MGEKKRGRARGNRFERLIDQTTFVRIFIFWAIMTLNFSAGYFILSTLPGQTVSYQGVTIQPTIQGIENSMYLSLETILQIGYETSASRGWTKLLALLEIVTGLLVYALIIVKLVSFKQDTILEEMRNINFEEAFTNLRRGLSLVRTDLVLTIERIESGTIKPKEIKDLWVILTGLDQTLNNIKTLAVPNKDSIYNRTFDNAKLELMLNSMKLSMGKLNELIKTLKAHNLTWKEGILVSSINYELNVCREIMDYELKRISEQKVIDKINLFKALLDEIEKQVGEPEHHEEQETHEEIILLAQPEEAPQKEQAKTSPSDSDREPNINAQTAEAKPDLDWTQEGAPGLNDPRTAAHDEHGPENNPPESSKKEDLKEYL